MSMEFRVVADTVTQLGEELLAASLVMLGDMHPTKNNKGLAGYTDDELLLELSNRGFVLDGTAADVADKPAEAETTKTKSEDKAAETPAKAKSKAKKEEPAEAETEKSEPEMTPQQAYDKALDLAMNLYSGDTKPAVMAVLKDYDVKSFRDIDPETQGHDFYSKIMKIQEAHA